MKIKYILSVVFFIIAIVVFYLMFFLAAPFVANLIPESAWKPFVDFLVYCIIAYMGGIGLPLAFLIFSGAILFYDK
jgi:hypothetical protein